MIDAKFGACEWALPGNGIDSVKIAKEIGLSGLQLGFVSYERGFLLSQKRFRDFYLEQADEYGIALPSMAVCEFDNYGLRNPKTTEKGKIVNEIIDLAIEAAAYMNMQLVMMPSFVDGFIDTDQDLEITAEALKYACKLAGKYDIVIATENLLPIEKNTLLFEKVGEGNLKGFYDSQNYKSNLGWEQVPMLEKLYDVLYPEIHVKDGIGKENSSRLLGEGDTDFYGTISFLKRKNYNGWIHLENFYDRLPLRLKSPKDYVEVAKMDLKILKAACE
jgi:sugar phosphate isomerase/epimerase